MNPVSIFGTGFFLWYARHGRKCLEVKALYRPGKGNCSLNGKGKILLRKRSVMETVNDELKNRRQMEHSRHRSFPGFIVNTIAAFIAYSFFPKKPAIKYQSVKANQIVLFQNRTPVIREKERTQLASGENKSKKSPFP